MGRGLGSADVEVAVVMRGSLAGAAGAGAGESADGWLRPKRPGEESVWAKSRGLNMRRACASCNSGVQLGKLYEFGVQPEIVPNVAVLPPSSRLTSRGPLPIGTARIGDAIRQSGEQ